MATLTEGEPIWAQHDGEWRDSADVVAGTRGAGQVDPQLLRVRARGAWWELLDELGICLVASREYEHLLVAMAVRDGKPHLSHLPLPHPSGIAVDRGSGRVVVASTRNPNQVVEFRPATGVLSRLDVDAEADPARPLVPVATAFYPGALYLHDLAFIGGRLHGNAVGQNAVARLEGDGGHEPVWWPRCIEVDGKPELRRNHIQLNSIAAGASLADSYFSASAEELTRRRPGHRDFPVDGRGIVFSGRTREPVARGLTRPHSARLDSGRLWVANSGYGELGVVEDGRLVPVARLPGWTRGLALVGSVAFVGSSRVLPRFRSYAPGLDLERSTCAIHAVDTTTGAVLGSATWAGGNQIFAVDWLPRTTTLGWPLTSGRAHARSAREALLYVPGGLMTDFRLLMIGAMYENGGNTTHRLLDGHPQLSVYPFESQLGTRLVNDPLASMFPAKYRWPVFALDATPEQDYAAIIDEETKVRARTPDVSKFRDYEFDFSDDERRDRYVELVRAAGRSRAANVEAFFRATFDVWKNVARSGREEVYVGYSPALVVDAETILAELPSAQFLHVVRNPWSAFADTKKRPVPLSLASYMLAWVVNQHHALLAARRFPGRLHIFRLEDVLADPVDALGGLCAKLGLETSDALAAPSWNGEALAEVYPWGTIRAATPEANRATAAELSRAERDEVTLRAGPFLEAFGYEPF